MFIDDLALSLVVPLQSPSLAFLMTLVTYLGSLFFMGLLVAVLLASRKRKEAMVLAAGVLLVIALIFPVKYLVARPRPPGGLIDIDPILDTAGYSFPSGHAAFAFMAAYVLSGCFGRRRWLLAVATLVAFSRLYLGVHYISDVIVGSIAGLACGALAIRERGRIEGLV